MALSTTIMCVASSSAGLSRCLLRLNPPQIAVGIPNRGQRDREPRRVSQPLFCVRASRSRCLFGRRAANHGLHPKPRLSLTATQSRAATTCLPAEHPGLCMASEGKSDRRHLSLTTRHHPIPTHPLLLSSSLQTPVSIPLRAWLTRPTLR